TKTRDTARPMMRLFRCWRVSGGLEDIGCDVTPQPDDGDDEDQDDEQDQAERQGDIAAAASFLFGFAFARGIAHRSSSESRVRGATPIRCSPSRVANRRVR